MAGMYCYNDTDTIRVTEGKDEKGYPIFHYRSRATHYVRLKGDRIDVIPTDRYLSFLDQRLEKPRLPLPAVEDSSGELIPGHLYENGLKTVYKLEKVVQTEKFNSVIMSHQTGEIGHKKFLSEKMCEYFGIEYKPKLIIFPADIIAWRQFDPEKKVFDNLDLSTYPTSALEEWRGSIRYMVLKLSGFKNTSDKNIIQTPGGDFLDAELFLVSLRISIKNDIQGIGSYQGYKKGEDVPWTMITGDFKGSEKVKESDFIDIEGNMYIIIRLVKNGGGISPLSLTGRKAGDIFDVSWDNAFGIKQDGESVHETSKSDKRPPEYADNIFENKNNRYWRLIDPSSVAKGKQSYTKLRQKNS